MEPILFRIGSAVVSSYAFMLSLSFVLGGLLALLLAAREGAPLYRLAGLIVAIQIASVVGSRAAFILSLDEPVGLAQAFVISPGGFALNGGLALAVAVALVYTRVAALPFWHSTDWLAPALALGLPVARTGCFLGGCCYGTATSVRWAVEFPAGSLAASAYGLPHRVHPTQIYEGLGGLAILVLILTLRRRRAFEGQLFLMLAITYMGVRFLMDPLRVDAVHGFFLGLTRTQFFSLAVAVLAGILYGVRWRAARAGQ